MRAGSKDPGDGGARARRGSYSRSASGADDDRASDFEDEPVPYCESHLEELHDAPTPVGNLVDRVQVGVLPPGLCCVSVPLLCVELVINQ